MIKQAAHILSLKATCISFSTIGDFKALVFLNFRVGSGFNPLET